jgi:APA family basic amino acid/polyamine antiporter
MYQVSRRERLGPWRVAAGWWFVVDKTASCAATALTFATHTIPGSPWAQPAVPVTVVLALASLNYRGVAKTVLLTRAPGHPDPDRLDRR